MAKNSTATEERELTRRETLFDLSAAEMQVFYDLEELLTSEPEGWICAAICTTCGYETVDRNGDTIGTSHICAPGDGENQLPRFGLFESSDGDVSAILINQSLADLDAAQEKRDAKLDRMCAARRFMLWQLACVEAEKKRLDRRLKAKQAAMERFDERLKIWFQGRPELTTIETRSGLNKISYYETGKAPVEFLEGKSARDLPELFTRPPKPQEVEADKENIARALVSDFIAYGATPEERQEISARVRQIVKLGTRPKALRFS